MLPAKEKKKLIFFSTAYAYAYAIYPFMHSFKERFVVI